MELEITLIWLHVVSGTLASLCALWHHVGSLRPKQECPDPCTRAIAKLGLPSTAGTKLLHLLSDKRQNMWASQKLSNFRQL